MREFFKFSFENNIADVPSVILPYAPEQAGFVLMNCELPGEGQEVRSLSEFKEEEVFVVRE